MKTNESCILNLQIYIHQYFLVLSSDYFQLLKAEKKFYQPNTFFLSFEQLKKHYKCFANKKIIDSKFKTQDFNLFDDQINGSGLKTNTEISYFI